MSNVETRKEKQQHPAPARDDIRIAQQAYTLARMLSEHLATAQPWTVAPGTPVFEAPGGYGFWPH
jgi:hypothetical protein